MTREELVEYCRNIQIYCTDIQDLADIIAIINNYGITVHGRTRKDNKRQLEEYMECLVDFPYLVIGSSEMHGNHYPKDGFIKSKQFIEWYYEH